MTSILKAPERRWAHARRAASSAGAVLGLALLPKCPLCVAAYLIGLGASAGAAYSAAPFIRPAAWLLALALLTALAAGLWHRKRAKLANAIPSAEAACCSMAAQSSAAEVRLGRVAAPRTPAGPIEGGGPTRAPRVWPPYPRGLSRSPGRSSAVPIGYPIG